MNLIKINKKYSNSKLIYLDKDTYIVFKKLFKDIKKIYNYNLIITGKAFNLLLNNDEIMDYIDNNLTKYGLIKENNYYYFIGKEAYIINKYHLTLEGYIKMFK